MLNSQRARAGLLAKSRRLARNAFASLTDKRFLRFLVAGGINMAFGFAIYGAMIFADASVWAALLAANVLGTLFNFFTTGSYVFRQLSLRRLPHFLLSYVFVYFVNLGAIELISVWLSDKILAQALLVLPMALLTYLCMLKLVFSLPRVG